MSFKEREQFIKECFDQLDTDKDGKITREEAKAHFEKLNVALGRDYSDKDVNSFFKDWDLNEDNVIDINEYRAAFYHTYNIHF